MKTQPMRTTCFLLFAAMLVSSVASAETILITGSNRGIGLEFAKQYADKGWHVIATHRRELVPDTLAELSSTYDNVQVETLDVNNAAHLEALVDTLDGMPIDVLLNNAAVMGINATGTLAEQTNENFGTLVPEHFMPYFTTNVLAPLLVSEALVENVLASDRKMILNMTSGAGSVTVGMEAFAGTGFFYKSTKAALNRNMVNLAAHLRTMDPDAITFNLAPGFTITERFEGMAEDEIGNRGTPVKDVVAGFIEVIDQATPEYSGNIYGFEGELKPF